MRKYYNANLFHFIAQFSSSRRRKKIGFSSFCILKVSFKLLISARTRIFNNIISDLFIIFEEWKHQIFSFHRFFILFFAYLLMKDTLGTKRTKIAGKMMNVQTKYLINYECTAINYNYLWNILCLGLLHENQLSLHYSLGQFLAGFMESYDFAAYVNSCKPTNCFTRINDLSELIIDLHYPRN